MGIPVEFCPDLALRDMGEFRAGRRKKDECLPEVIEAGKVYNFLKKGQRMYWFSDDPFWSEGEMPLCRTEGNTKLSRPVASVKMLEVTHFLEEAEIWTRGKYKVIDVFDAGVDKINFEGLKRVR